MVDFSKKLKELRERSGLTQQQLAEKLWVTKATVSYYELAERNPSPEMLIRIANAFHVTTDYLLGLEDRTQIIDVSDLPPEDVEFVQSTVDMLRRKNSGGAESAQTKRTEH